VGKPVLRVDARGKVTGELKYLSDLSFPDMLWGRVLRAAYPHALIKRIDTSKAKALPGVACVLTHKDVHGLNRFGIAVPDMPVLCEDKVRYLGDAVALVAAETKEVAARALEQIEVDYEPLPVVDDPEKAFEPDAPKVHEKGNVLWENTLGKGDVKVGFAESDFIVEQKFSTQMFEHAFLETEGGVAKYDADTGIVHIWVGSQYAYRDQLQIARATGWDRDKIHVVGSPVGGAFGGKDEITIQIYLALLTYATRRPVKMVLNRTESIISGTKRHPMKMDFKVGCKKDGTLQAVETNIFSDTGAYASLGGPVLNLALEGASGPYFVPHAHLVGHAMYTNNGFSGAFRGFGTTQSCVGIEICLDMLAEKIGLDPIDFRLKNAIHRGQQTAIDNKLFTSCGMEETLQIAKQSDLWKQREARKAAHTGPVKYGVGVASEIQALGLGIGIPDYAHTRVELTEEGKYIVRQGSIEIGQGNLTAFAQMAAEILGCPIEHVTITHGDTDDAADSGTSTASRTIYAVGNSISRASKNLVKAMEIFAGEQFPGEWRFERGALVSGPERLEPADLARKAATLGRKIEAEGFFKHIEAEKEYTDGLPHCLYAFCTQVASVKVDTETGIIRVEEILTIPDCGRAINPQGIEGQAEGGAAQGMSYVLFEEVKLHQGRFLNPRFATYILPTTMDMPRVNTRIVESWEDTHEFGAKGIAETVMVPVAPAIVNAIYHATGVRFFELPITPEKMLRAWREKHNAE